MERYLNLGGNSNVEAYSIHATYIDVKFRGTSKIYRNTTLRYFIMKNILIMIN